MKTIVQSLAISLVIHLIYLIGTLLVGYIKTKNYMPDIENTWGSVDTLQNEVAFGTVGSPLFFLSTFIGTAVICGLLIISYGKVTGLKETKNNYTR